MQTHPRGPSAPGITDRGFRSEERESDHCEPYVTAGVTEGVTKAVTATPEVTAVIDAVTHVTPVCSQVAANAGDICHPVRLRALAIFPVRMRPKTY
jgi:hypothetical protein